MLKFMVRKKDKRVKEDNPIVKEGKIAFSNNVALFENPYRKNTEERPLWKAGWLDAQKSREDLDTGKKRWIQRASSSRFVKIVKIFFKPFTVTIDKAFAVIEMLGDVTVALLWGLLYLLWGLAVVGTFLGGWIYAIAAYGFFLGLPFGWIPSLIIACIVGVLFPVILVLCILALGVICYILATQ